uniref:Cyclic nucleotide-binding domain-containing protein n=1 Tax=Mucochytrium quahogii TaxID=96639 RepID=A0A7S2RSQ4_9STRA
MHRTNATVGFEAFFGGRSIVFSADHMNDPTKIRELCDAGVVSPGRRDSLLEFPWQHDLILHEAGVPPIHTPMETLSALPDDVKRRLYVVHVSIDKIPPNSGLRAAIPGVENTIVVDNVEEPPHAKALEILDLVSSIPIFSRLTVKHASDILSFCKAEHFCAGDCIVRKGDEGTCFYAMMSGTAEVRVEKPPSRARSRSKSIEKEEEKEEDDINLVTVKIYHAGDYFGEQALISDVAIRTADIYAMNDVKVLRFDRSDFTWLLKNTNIVEQMSSLAEMRNNGSWEAMSENSILGMLSVSQKTQLETCFSQKFYKAGENIYAQGEVANKMILVQDGSIRFSLAVSPVRTIDVANHNPSRRTFRQQTYFKRGMLIVDVQAVMNDEHNQADLIVQEDASVLEVSGENLKNLFKNNPGLLLSLINIRYTA